MGLLRMPRERKTPRLGIPGQDLVAADLTKRCSNEKKLSGGKTQGGAVWSAGSASCRSGTLKRRGKGGASTIARLNCVGGRELEKTHTLRTEGGNRCPDVDRKILAHLRERVQMDNRGG